MTTSFFTKIGLALMIGLFTYHQQSHACGLTASISTSDDDFGNSYAAWNVDGLTYVNTKNAGSPTWNTSLNISAGQIQPKETSSPTLTVSRQGKAIVSWIGPIDVNCTKYGIYSSMYSNGAWGPVALISADGDAIMNASFEIDLIDAADTNNVVLIYYGQVNGVNQMRVSTATFGDQSTWSNVTSMP